MNLVMQSLSIGLFVLMMNLFDINTVYSNSLLQRLEVSANKEDTASQLALALHYYKEDATDKELQQAVKWLKVAAQNDVLDAQVVLASLYENGRGTTKDLKKALYWNTRAAQKEDKEAKLKIGQAYYYGLGTTVDYQTALPLLIASFENGYSQVSFAVASIYLSDSENKDIAQGIKFLRYAASENHIIAQQMLGNFYFEGNIVEQDFQEAARWYILSSANATTAIKYRLGWMYYYGKGLPKNGQQAQIWFSAVVSQDYPAAAMYLAILYEQGIGVEQSDSKAYYWYKQSAQYGNTLSHKKLGYMLYKGVGIEPNVTHAIEHFVIFLEHEADAKIARLIADLSFKGTAIPQDYKTAIFWYIKSFNQGDVSTAYVIGTMFYEGLGVVPNKQKALFWWKKAAASGLPSAQHSLATLYYQKEEFDQAFSWYKRAAEQGYRASWSILAFMYGNGRGVELDNTGSYVWYQLAVLSKQEGAAKNLKVIYRELSIDQHQEALELAKKWKEKFGL